MSTPFQFDIQSIFLNSIDEKQLHLKKHIEQRGPPVFYSQWGQDKWLFENIFNTIEYDCKFRSWASGRPTTGVRIFVEVGASDGIKFSNSKFFEDHLGWKGILIEPNKISFENLIKNRSLEENMMICGCAYNSTGIVDFRQGTGYVEMLSGIESCYDERHIARFEKESIEEKCERYTIVQSSTFQLKDLFKKHQITDIEVVSIDTEGSELEVILGIDFKEVRIKVFIIENNYPDTLRQKHIEFIMEGENYKRVGKLGGDDIWIAQRT